MATRTGPVVSLMQSTLLGTPDVIKPAAQVGPQRGPFRNQLPVPSQLRPPLHLTVHLAALCPQCLLHCWLRPVQSRFHLPRWNCRGLRRLQLCHHVDLCWRRVRAKAVVGFAADGGGNLVQGWHPHTTAQLKQMNMEEPRMSWDLKMALQTARRAADQSTWVN